MRNLKNRTERWLALLLTCPLFWSCTVSADECVVDIALADGKNNWLFSGNSSTIQIGYWDVDNGGAEAAGAPLGSDYINLSGLRAPMSTQDCIEEIRLSGGDWNQQRNPPIGFNTMVGWWDVDDGGSLDTDNRSTTHRMTLFVKKMAKTDNPPKSLSVVQDIGMVISDSKPDWRANTPSRFPDYTQIGWWDVDDAGGCGTMRNLSRCGKYGAEFFVKRVPFINEDEVKAVTFTGRWEAVNTCRGSGCGETSFQLMVGAEQGKEISKSSTFGKSLSTMIGAEAKGTSGALPGVEFTAKVEVTGQISSEQQDALVNSFSIKRESTTAVTCSGAGVMWQWKSTLRIQRATRVEEIQADSLLTVCAPVGVRPKNANDIGWDPEAGATPAVVRAGHTLTRGQKIDSSSGAYYAMLQDDGNFVVKKKDGSYVWGLDRIVPDKLAQIGKITFQEDGNLVASSASGEFIWSALRQKQAEGTYLRLTDEGLLQILTPDHNVIWTAAQ